MKILDIKNITREDGEIFYRRTFTGTAVIQFPLTTTEEPVTFTIEMTPLGTWDWKCYFLTAMTCKCSKNEAQNVYN